MTTDRAVIGFDLGHGETALALAFVDACSARVSSKSPHQSSRPGFVPR
jgi:hypothetical protein